MSEWLAMLVVAVALAGCSGGAPGGEGASCAADSDCTAPLACGADGRCTSGSSSLPDASVSGDLASTTGPTDLGMPPTGAPPAAAWLSSGGGSTSANGLSLNASVGGSLSVGIATAPGGGSYTAGLLCTDTF